MKLDITPEQVIEETIKLHEERGELWSITNKIIEFNRHLNKDVKSVDALESIPKKLAEIKQLVTKYSVDKKNNAEYLVSLFNGTVKHIDEVTLDILKNL